MTEGVYRFDRFVLDAGDRRLLDGQTPVEINARYLDALALLVREHGRLLTKDRFLDEVWRGVPVTDEALTQCIRSLRRILGDDATRPRFIETVPKHGYRFIAPLEPVRSQPPFAPAASGRLRRWDPFFREGRAGMIGGGLAGLVGGVIYGFAIVADTGTPGGGAISAVLVIACLTMVIGLIGGAGVGFGVASSLFASTHTRPWAVAGGAGGGMMVGAVAKLVGLDAFTLLFGEAPGHITGAAEGAVLGGAIGLGVWAIDRFSARTTVLLAGLLGITAGALISMGGGRLMGGSLNLLAMQFPGSRIRMEHLGILFGENGWGPVSGAVTAGLEGLLFVSFVVAAVLWDRKRRNS
ncbi:MAG TPA: winged helix-turn-helix domain-containing protein, partial [Brevundimonas sp.]